MKKAPAEAGATGDPNENRTRDSALRGRRLNRLTIGPIQTHKQLYHALIGYASG